MTSGGRNSNSTRKVIKNYVRACESMEDYSSGLGSAPPLSVTNYLGTVGTGYSQIKSGQIPWIIIGNGKSFWFFCRRNWLQSTGSYDAYLRYKWYAYFFGDYDSLYPHNSWNFALIQDAQPIGNYPETNGAFYYPRADSIMSSYIMRDVYFRPGGAKCILYKGDIDNDQFSWYTDYGPTINDVWPISYSKGTITYGNYIMGTLPGALFPQARKSVTLLPDKKIVNSDHTLHFLMMSSDASSYGYMAFIEGEGYDDAT